MKLLSRIVALCGFVIFNINSIAQERFNVRTEIGLSAAVFVGVSELEDGYGVVGNGVNPTDSGNYTPLYFTRFTLGGDFVDRKMYFPDSGFNLITYESGMRFINEQNKYSCIGYKDDGSNPREGFLANFDEEGDTIQIIYYSSPYFGNVGNSTIAPVGLSSSINTDNSFFISSNILNTESGSTGGDFYIQRMAPDGEVLWEYIYATDAQPEYCNALLPTENGGVLGLVHLFNAPLGFIKLNSLGEEIINLNTNYVCFANDLVWSSDENILAAGYGLGTDGLVTGKVFKIDTLGSLVWDTVVGNGFDQFDLNQFYKVVKSLDESGYVAGGTKKEFIPEEEQTDSTGTTISQGWLVKVNEDGDVLWDRTYHYINTPQEEHTLNDLKATTDGGYIFCGESRDLDSDQEYTEGPPQQGWLVKVDEFGCLVEDCQLSDDINVIEIEGNKKYFKAGPIPAADFLNIYQSFNTSSGASYELIDMTGKVIENFSSMSKGTTMMLDVSKYNSGTYLLNLMDGGKLLQSEKIVID